MTLRSFLIPRVSECKFQEDGFDPLTGIFVDHTDLSEGKGSVSCLFSEHDIGIIICTFLKLYRGKKIPFSLPLGEGSFPLQQELWHFPNINVHTRFVI